MVHFPSFIFRMWDTLVFSTLGLMQLDSWRLMFSFNNKFSILDLNDFAIIYNSDIGSFQDKNIIRRPDDFDDCSAALSWDLLMLIGSDLNRLSINLNCVLLTFNSVSWGGFHHYFSFMHKNLDFLLTLNFFSKNREQMLAGAISSKNMIAVIKLIAVGSVIKGFYNTVTNSAHWK